MEFDKLYELGNTILDETKPLVERVDAGLEWKRINCSTNNEYSNTFFEITKQHIKVLRAQLAAALDALEAAPEKIAAILTEKQAAIEALDGLVGKLRDEVEKGKPCEPETEDPENAG
jgi:hypothetical protein